MSSINTHLLPFSVDKEGPINTKQYFKYEKQENGEYETIMLGRKLVGRSVTVSDKTQGYVFEKAPLDDYEEEEEQEGQDEKEMPWIKTNKSIQEFILWKKDTAPDAEDPRINALSSWIDLSEAIHEPIPLPPS